MNRLSVWHPVRRIYAGTTRNDTNRNRKCGIGPMFRLPPLLCLIPRSKPLYLSVPMFKTVTAQFLQVPISLFRTDERRGHTGMYYFTFLCFETDNGSGMEIRFCFSLPSFKVTGTLPSGYIIRSLISKRLVELNNEIVLKVGRNTTAVTGSITDNFVFSGITFTYEPRSKASTTHMNDHFQEK